MNGGLLGRLASVCYHRHMFRTRDFVLLFVTVVFLLIAIGLTLFERLVVTDNTEGIFLVDNTKTTYTAVLDEGGILPREQRLAEMRQKIAAGGEIVLSAPQDDPIPEPESPEDVVVETEDSAVVQKCSSYSAYSGNWSPHGVQIDEVEGAHIVYRVSQSVLVASTTEAAKEILIQMPVQPVRTAPTCLSSEVVGIASDGSLIKNDEVGLYGVFDEETLIGYALDGIPIYGVSSIHTDSCGGVVVLGEYRYYLSAERSTIVNCFSASPMTLN